MRVLRTNSNHLEVEKLPDGSTVIFDSLTKTVYSLNETAAAAWMACDGPRSLSEIVDAMRRSLSSTVTDEIAVDALYQLREQGLVAIEMPASGLTRRSFTGTAAATAAGVMAPVVLALTSTEQRAFAQVAGSGTTTTTTTTTKPPTTTTTTTTTTSTTTTTTSTTTTALPAVRNRK